MPVMDGFTAVQGIREWETQKKKFPTPIIALSAYGMENEMDLYHVFLILMDYFKEHAEPEFFTFWNHNWKTPQRTPFGTVITLSSNFYLIFTLDNPKNLGLLNSNLFTLY